MLGVRDAPHALRPWLLPAFEEDRLKLVSCRVFEGEQHFFGRGHKKVMRWYEPICAVAPVPSQS